MPPLLNIPARPTDLEAAQRAGQLLLRWTWPAQTTEGFPIKDLDRVEVWGLEAEGELPGVEAFQSRARRLAVLEPPSLARHRAGERMELRLPLPVTPGHRVAVAVKNVNRRGRSEGFSNLAMIEIASAPAAPESLRAVAQANAIRLEWSEVPGADGYRLYRSTGENPAFALLASVSKPPLDDPDFSWGGIYSYFVRAYTATSSGLAESADSSTAAVVPQDSFPPSPPLGLQAVAGESAVELSWIPSPELDAAGYHVYRSSAGRAPARCNRELVVAAAFTDRDVRGEQQYSYAVSAVDQKGNQSAPSVALLVTVR